MCMHSAAPKLHQPGLYRTTEVLSNLPHFAVWVVVTSKTSSKISIKPSCVAWKEWVQNFNYNPNIFAKFHLCGTAVTRFYI